jgi:hypothetical protein
MYAADAQTVHSVKPNAKRIQFPRKRNTAVVKGSVAPGGNEIHTFAARAKQQLTLKLTSENTEVLFILLSPEGQIFGDALGTREWSGELPAKGNYKITIVNNQKGSRDSAYTLEVTLK